MTTVRSWRFGEMVYCGGRLDGGVEVGRRGIFGIVVWYRRLSHMWEGGGSTETKEEKRKKNDGKVSQRLGGRLRGRHATLISFTIFGQAQLVK